MRNIQAFQYVKSRSLTDLRKQNNAHNFLNLQRILRSKMEIGPLPMDYYSQIS